MERSHDMTSAAPPQLNYREILCRYHAVDLRVSWIQCLNSFLPFLILWGVMVQTLEISYGLTLLLMIPTSGFLMRIFCIQHECGHGAFFKTKQANDRLGLLCSLLTLTPYHYWLRSHAYHHAHIGHLDRQETGYITLKTVDQYLSSGPWEKLKYRLYRHPIILFLIGPSIKFWILQRLTYGLPPDWHKEKRGIHLTNAVLVLLIGVLIGGIGWQHFLLIQIPIVGFTAMIGVWTFFVQHTFNPMYWRSGDQWDYLTACQHTSSYYALPKLLQWFTLNNGIHHIHHLDSRIPNYRLQACHQENPEFQTVQQITLLESFNLMFLALWDEKQGQMIRFSQLRAKSSASDKRG